MYPVFFSVSSKDIEFAEQVWVQFPDDWVYLYSKTGEEGVHMWDEISRRELPQSQILVVFWSKDFMSASGCVREILQAKDLVQQGRLRTVILRLDDFPISSNGDLDEDARPVFEALKSMLDYRTSAPGITVAQATGLVQRIAEPILKSDHPRLPRHDLQQVLRDTAKNDRFTCYPAMWISGFNGVGRETLVREINRNFAPNGQGFVVEVDESTLPKQVRLRIESEAFGADRERLRQLNASPDEEECKAVSATIERAFNAGNYIIFRHSRIIEESVDLPEWLDEVVNALTPSTRPKLFIISQMPLLGDRRTKCRDALVAQRVPTVDEYQMREFSTQLIAHFDSNPNRWTDQEIGKLVHASGGNLGFLVSLVRAASRIEDFDQIDQIVASDSANMAASITTYVRWATAQLRNSDDEMRLLLFLNDISPCDIVDLERVISPSKPILRVLGKLLDLGLVERENDNLYRLTPLLANRLSRNLLRPDLLGWLRRVLIRFVEEPFEMEDEGNEYLRIETRIQAAMISDSSKLPNSVVDFVSAAHWFHAGIRLYHARRREPAYRILKKAFERRSEFSQASRVELARYFALSATRNRKYKDCESCIELLDSVHSTKSMAAFLTADMYENKRNFIEAIRYYEESIKLDRSKDSRLERTYRPLIRCILYSPRPDYALAEDYALKWLDIRETVFSLLALARVYLHWKYHGFKHGRDVPSDVGKAYDDALAELENDPGAGSAPFELKSEEAVFSGNFGDALDYMDKAVAADPRFELLSERWRLMAKFGDKAIADQVLRELDAGRNNPDYRANWQPFLPALAETYAIALRVTGRPLGSLNTFAPELPSDDIGAIVGRVSRRH